MTDTHRLPAPVAETWDWQMRAKCRDMDDSAFFHPEQARGQTRQQREERAKAVCGACPVIDDCRRHALSVRERYGVWGGMTEHERLVELAARRQYRTV